MGEDHAAAAQPDLLLTDLELPGISGDEAIRRLKADPTTAPIPVAVCTARAMREDEIGTPEAGCAAYLAKPPNSEKVRDSLSGFLGDDPAEGPRGG